MRRINLETLNDDVHYDQSYTKSMTIVSTQLEVIIETEYFFLSKSLVHPN